MDHVSGHLHDPSKMEETVAFYRKLGFNVLHEEEWRSGLMDKIAINAGEQKMHIRTDMASNVAPHVGWVWEGGIDNLIQHIRDIGLEVHRGPTTAITGRDNATARGIVIIVCDPEGSWVAFVSYDEADLSKYGGPTYDEQFMAAAAQGEEAVATFRQRYQQPPTDSTD
jgi:hypothetical protein